MHYGNLLKNYIRNKGAKQVDLAEKIEIPFSTLNSWLNKNMSSLEGLHVITQYFGDPIWKPLLSEADSIMPRPEWLKPEYEAVIRNLDGLPLEKRIKVLRGLKEFLEAMVEEEGK
jgi:transcriptional regulator with XRE-family HTH domain